ncbi:MAG: lysophospholipid acyltransferase family protein [Lachnospiraceae bacterium]|jgi:1-acyl-sn-glycerol-3-phosphate acyltransferase
MSNVSNWRKLTIDIGNVFLSPLILHFRVKKLYADNVSPEEIKALKGALIAANHVGFSDPLILNSIFWNRRFFYTASEEVMTGFKGRLLNAAGCIKLDRTTADFEGIKRCAAVLKDGSLLGLFPQGHIDGDGAKGGMVLIAAMAKVPIVPTYIGKRKRFWLRHKVVFGKPVNIADYTQKFLPGKNEIDMILEEYDRRMEACRDILQKQCD